MPDPQPPPSALSPPAGSNITIDRYTDGVTITVPPAGIWRGSHGLFLFAIVWNAFLCLFTPLMLFSVFSAPQQRWAYFALPAFLSLFWFVGLGLLLAAINMGRRQAALAVTHGRLLVIQTSLLGSRQQEWPAESLDDVRAAPSGIEVNGRPVLELQIIPREGAKFGLLAGRTDAELLWLANELRTALQLPE